MGLGQQILEDVLLQQLLLRVLCLRGARIRTLPDTISNLKQLRHLDVSYSDVEEFPASLCKLYNLRSLLCESCDQIKEFHYDMAAFVSLRHFTLSGRQLQKAPWNLSQLSQVKLQFYHPYSVGHGSDSSGSRDTKEGEVDVIVNIDRSTFRFDTDDEDVFIACDLLESLRPHRDVKEVRIRKFNGTAFPGWLVDRSYSNIEKVELLYCQISSGLMPALGGLPSLKHLQLKGVRNITKLGSELYNSTEDVPFGSLEELYFDRMEEWEEWEPSDDAAAGGGICFFPRLQKLSLCDCPKLKGRLPSNLPSLEELSFSDMYEWEEWEPSDDAAAGGGICFFPRLKKLSIVSCPKLKGRLPSNLPSLEELPFSDMYEWEEWEPSDDAGAGGGICFFPRLQKLSMVRCPKLKGRLPSNLPSLKMLYIFRCSSLVEINGCHRRQVVDLVMYRCDPRLTNSCLVDMRLGMFPHLQRLKIGDCDSLESFPAKDSLPTSLTYLWIGRFVRLKKLDVFGLQSLTNLETLVIYDCPLLESLGYSSDVDDGSSDDEFPFNLEELMIDDCPLLESLGYRSDVDDGSSDDEFPFNSSLRRESSRSERTMQKGHRPILA